MKRTFVSAIAVMAIAGVASAAEIWLSAGGTGGAVGGAVVIPTIGGTGAIETWLDYHGATDTVGGNGTGWAISFDGFGQTRNNDTAVIGDAHFTVTGVLDPVTGNFGTMVPNDTSRGMGTGGVNSPLPVGGGAFGGLPNGNGYVFSIVHNGPFDGSGEGYFGDGTARKADELIVTGNSQTVLPDAAFLINAAPLTPSFIEVTDYNGTIGTQDGTLTNLSKSATSGNVSVTVLPEPASLALLLIGGLAAARRRR
jgi:hypothetical protein